MAAGGGERGIQILYGSTFTTICKWWLLEVKIENVPTPSANGKP